MRECLPSRLKPPRLQGELMTIRNVFVILTFVVAMFVPSRIARLITHQPYGSVAWAQETTEAEQSEDVTSEPDVTPPAIAGTWSGPITDDTFGGATFTADIFQKKSKLRGDWSVSAGGSGTFKGKIKSDGVTVAFKFKEKGKACQVASSDATLINADTEMTGTYTAKHCSHATTGHFDLTKQ